VSPPAVDPTARLERLAALHDRGSITTQEYDAAKAALLGTTGPLVET
jgi:hypothetical protein